MAYHREPEGTVFCPGSLASRGSGLSSSLEGVVLRVTRRYGWCAPCALWTGLKALTGGERWCSSRPVQRLAAKSAARASATHALLGRRRLKVRERLAFGRQRSAATMPGGVKRRTFRCCADRGPG